MVRKLSLSLVTLISVQAFAQNPELNHVADTVAEQAHYTGTVLSNPYRHDGGLSPVIGVHNIQTMHAQRDLKEPNALGDTAGWTYNHQPMLASWNGQLWMHYLSDPKSEHAFPSRTLLQHSADGHHWSEPEVLFPIYATEGREDEVAAVMHQRVGWYVSSKATGSRLIAIGHYGICRTMKDDPNDGNGIGRVVREVNKDGSLGPIYFLYYNHDYNEKNTRFPLFTRAKNKQFRKACEEILQSPIYWMQMVEECNRDDERLPIKNTYKAFNCYSLEDGSLVAFWKHALTSRSFDGGKSWTYPAKRAQGFVNSNAKIWGQRLSDGTYATVYNPSEYRWPLAISTSQDGLNYTTLNLVNGEVPPMRYGGQFKSYGPQYTRGVQESVNHSSLTPNRNDTCFWVTYSINKEDIWVSQIPVPVRTVATSYDEPWNIYSPVLARIDLGDEIVLHDSDPYDYAKLERVIPATRELKLSFDIVAGQNNHGRLELELQDDHGTPCCRLQWQDDANVSSKNGARYAPIIKGYEAGRKYRVELLANLNTRMVVYTIDGKEQRPKMLFAPISAITRIMFRTGEERFHPTVNTEADRPESFVLPNASGIDPEATWTLSNVHAESAQTSNTALLHWSDYRHYVDYFNQMENEHVVQAIPNSQSAEWMGQNIPLLDCPDRQVEEMFYYRWWTLRKHIVETPYGYGMTEFLVKRSYADQYNLIACAVGHHLMESRWLRDRKYADGIVNVWLRGNHDPKKGGDSIQGAPMQKLHKFSSLIPYAMWQRTLVLGDTAWFNSYRPDLEKDMFFWEKERSYKDGLFWQSDVEDGMEESISGGRYNPRKKKFFQYRRPTINSYMVANYRVLGMQQKADSLLSLMEDKMWDKERAFYGTLTQSDSIAQVRELIGYLPWYFNLPKDDSAKYKNAWMQLLDEKGFDAPAGMTTAERRCPQFRQAWKGRPTCEWDGAIWPFATSQTLTALINVENNYHQLAASLPDNLFWHHFKKYTESMHFHGRPYVGEYLDETTGYWLWGEHDRSRYYNHSTYNDLVITGLCGFNPATFDGTAASIHPLCPPEWEYWCLDGILWHGKTVTILYDQTGDHYHQGKGLIVLVNGRKQ